MCEHNLGHTGKVVIEERCEDTRLKCLYKPREARQIGEKRCYLAALPAKIDRVCVHCQTLCKVRREVAGQRRMRPFRLRLSLSRFAQRLDMADCLRDRRLKVGEIDGLR